MAKVKVTTPAGNAGSVDILVTNPDGKTAVYPYVYGDPAPKISSVHPRYGPTGGGTEIIIQGADIHPDAVVTIDGNAASVIGAPDPPPDSDPPNPPDLGSLAITSLSRDIGSTAGGTVLEIVGDGFVDGAVASFGGVDAPSTIFNSAFLLTVTVPAHAAGLIDVVVTNPDNGTVSLQAAGAYGFEYLPAPTTTYVSHDFEDGTLGDFTTDWTAPIVGEWGAGFSKSGTFSVKAKKWNGSDGASKLVYSRSGLTPKNPPLEPTGVYQRWYQMMPQGSLDAAATGQIKLLLNRGGPGSWIVAVFGAESGGPELDELYMAQDENSGILPPSTGFVVKSDAGQKTSASATDFVLVADAWVEFQTWYYHDGTHGRARFWINGKEMFDVLGGTGTRVDPPCDCLGTDDATGVYNWELGVAWVQNNTTEFDAIVYVDDVVMANGYIEPVS